MTNHEDEPRSAFGPQRPLGAMSLEAHPEGGVASGERNGMDVEYVAEKIADGLGFGEGTISGAAIEAEAGAEAVGRVDELIASPRILVDVDRDGNGDLLDDDGCGDGRMVGLIKQGRNVLQRAVNSVRAKVFGGGSAMATADLIGSGEATGSLTDTFGHAIRTLVDKEIGFGAHEDTHAHGPKCGCGAIDKAPETITAVGTYADKIRGVFGLLKDKVVGDRREDQEGETGRLLRVSHLDDIVESFQSFAATTAGQEYRGADVMDTIANRGKIIKRLEGDHIEARIVLNLVRGKTVNQQLVHDVSDGKVDVFAVDVWRLQDLAVRLHPEDETAQQRAFQSMLAYTLGVAAVLTKGDLPVYIIKPVEEPARAAEPEPALTIA